MGVAQSSLLNLALGGAFIAAMAAWALYSAVQIGRRLLAGRRLLGGRPA